LKLNLLAILTLLIFSSSFGQFAFNYQDFKLNEKPESSYFIIQTENGIVKRISEFDDKDRLIFKYRETEIPRYFKDKWKTPHRFIYGYEYDKSSRVTRQYDFNSNAGLKIFEYHYENNLKTTFELVYTDLNKPELNTNPYGYINKIKSFSDLIQFDETKNILMSKKRIRYIEKLNEFEEPIEIYENSRIFGDSIVTIIDYKEKGKKLTKKVIGLTSNEIKRKIVYDYSTENSVVTEIINFSNGKQTSAYRFAESKNFTNNAETSYSERRGILTIRHYNYDSENYPTKISVYETDFKGQLVIPLSSELKKTAEMVYSYDKHGLIKKEKMTNYNTGKKETRSYKYYIKTE